MGICDLELWPATVLELAPSFVEDLLTNLFGGSWGAGWAEDRMGAPEPNENMDGESGPPLDLMLSCWDRGRIDSRRIQEPLEDMESRGSSAIGAVGKRSGCLTSDWRQVPALGGVIWLLEARFGIRGWFVVFWSGNGSSVPEVEYVVPGREEKTFANVSLLLVFGMGGGGTWPSANWPKTRPVAAAATAVPDPMRLGTVCILNDGPYDEEEEPSGERREEKMTVSSVFVTIVRQDMAISYYDGLMIASKLV